MTVLSQAVRAATLVLAISSVVICLLELGFINPAPGLLEKEAYPQQVVLDERPLVNHRPLNTSRDHLPRLFGLVFASDRRVGVGMLPRSAEVSVARPSDSPRSPLPFSFFCSPPLPFQPFPEGVEYRGRSVRDTASAVLSLPPQLPLLRRLGNSVCTPPNERCLWGKRSLAP
jgi:hypothetical protein